MIEIVRSWVLNIVTVIIFLIIIEIVVPSNKFNKYVKFVAGLVIMIVIINPIVTVVNKGFTIDDITKQAFNQFAIAQIEKKYNEYESYQNLQILNLYEDEVENQILDKIKSVNNVYNADVNIDIQKDIDSDNFGQILNIKSIVYTKANAVSITNGKIQKVNIDIENSKEDEELKNNIVQQLSGIYQLSSDNIDITIH